MNGAHFHLIICHFPIFGNLFAIALILLALIRRSNELKNISLWAAVITGLLALGVYFTGEMAEEALMAAVPEITEAHVEPHESIALYYMIVLMVAGAPAAACLFFLKTTSSFFNKIFITVTILLFAASILAAYTGYTGGNIRHTENHYVHS